MAYDFVSGSYERCVKCSMSFFKTDSDECYLCRNTTKCVECSVPLISALQSVYCNNCWYTNGISKITDSIYLTDYKHATDYQKLKELNIKQILTIGRELVPHNTVDFKTMHINLNDHPSENISMYFDQAHAFMSADTTLVHCAAGISRSATIVVSYIMKTLNLRFTEAYKYCIERRKIINPNIGFLLQLKDYEEKIFA